MGIAWYFDCFIVSVQNVIVAAVQKAVKEQKSFLLVKVINIMYITIVELSRGKRAVSRTFVKITKGGMQQHLLI